jgi:flagellar biosynthesis/type III secretory pathway chaperone
MTALDLSPGNVIALDRDFEKLVDSLLSLLSKEIAIYEELRAIVQEEGGTLKRPSLELISGSNNRKETCILKARMLEEVRSNIVRKIARYLDAPERDVNISMLADHVSEQQRGALRIRQEKLLTLLEAIRDRNRRNRDLLDYSLSYVKNSVDFLNQMICTGADYARNGKLKTGGRNGAILCKEG